MITVSTDQSNWESNRDLAEKHPHIYYSVGLHPHDASRSTNAPRIYRRISRKTKSPPSAWPSAKWVSITTMISRRASSRSAPSSHSLRSRSGWTCRWLVHCRDAFADLFCVDKESGHERARRCHALFYGLEEAKQSLDLGFKIFFRDSHFQKCHRLARYRESTPAHRVDARNGLPILAPDPKPWQAERALVPTTNRASARLYARSVNRRDCSSDNPKCGRILCLG